MQAVVDELKRAIEVSVVGQAESQHVVVVEAGRVPLLEHTVRGKALVAQPARTVGPAQCLLQVRRLVRDAGGDERTSPDEAAEADPALSVRRVAAQSLRLAA